MSKNLCIECINLYSLFHVNGVGHFINKNIYINTSILSNSFAILIKFYESIFSDMFILKINFSLLCYFKDIIWYFIAANSEFDIPTKNQKQKNYGYFNTSIELNVHIYTVHRSLPFISRYQVQFIIISTLVALE